MNDGAALSRARAIVLSPLNCPACIVPFSPLLSFPLSFSLFLFRFAVSMVRRVILQFNSRLYRLFFLRRARQNEAGPKVFQGQNRERTRASRALSRSDRSVAIRATQYPSRAGSPTARREIFGRSYYDGIAMHLRDPRSPSHP